ncbi:MAG TPA: ABC transporter permease [bacterium]|nr:ABC transporter permease [bacterium]
MSDQAGFAARGGRLVERHRLAALGGGICAAAFLAALLGPALDRVSPEAVHVSVMLQPPSTAWPLGTDDLGRDILSRLLAGGRISLGVGLAATALAACGGVSAGLVSGYWGRWVDTALMRLADLLFAFPAMVLAVAIVGVLGPNLANATLAIAVVAMPRFARLVRGQVRVLREMEFIEAATATGATGIRIMRRHLLPNLLGLVTIEATLTVSFAILTEASLSFLGLGAQPPTASLGSMLRYGYPFLDQAPWIALAPGMAIMITILGLNLLGDGARDALDPRLRS